MSAVQNRMWKSVILVLFFFSFFLAAAISQAANPVPIKPVEAAKGMVASAHPLATEVGVEILKKGGNAVDAAVATAFALGVVEPNASGLGGGGFIMFYNAKTQKVEVIDYREVAPFKATPDMYKLTADGKIIDKATIGGSPGGRGSRDTCRPRHGPQAVGYDEAQGRHGPCDSDRRGGLSRSARPSTA